ncbi:MAG TPA: dTDP-4-dehydrorhamnose 3,5-epimerase [Kineosporiaceae bacterium]
MPLPGWRASLERAVTEGGVLGADAVTPAAGHEGVRLLAGVLGHPLQLAQANWSTSRRGVIRGIHYTEVPPGRAKYVTCVRGAVLDVRVGSLTFGHHDAVRLDTASPRAIYLAEGPGHGFCALTDDASVLYLCSTRYHPSRERSIHPLDPDLALPWPAHAERVPWWPLRAMVVLC